MSYIVGEVVHSLHIAPAVAPWETTLAGVLGGRGNNPSIRLVEYDRTTGAVLDIEQYYLNLRQANEEDQDNWEPAYKATEYYGLDDFSTKSLEYLTSELKDNDALFDKYYKANGVFFDPDETWDEEMRSVHYCAISQPRYEDYHSCLAVSRAQVAKGSWLVYVAAVFMTIFLAAQYQ